MPHGHSLEFSGVTKRFGAVTAVAGFTARVEPGQVTGFLGPNGAGKTTTLRILLGLVRATDGHATIDGRRYAELDHPLQTVGAVLEASSFHPGRTAAAHLTIYAQAASIARSRVDEVLDLVGLTDAANRKVGGFSLGMRQRLGLAYALLGDPGVLVLDEPANGLDPEGIRWMRGFLRQLAGEGRTVLVSSHLLAEVQQTVDALLIISRGRLVFQGSIDELTDPDEHATVVDAPDRAALVGALRAAGVPFEVLRSGLTVRGLEPAAVGAAAAAGGVALSSLHRRGPALEEVFLDLVNGSRVHASATGAVGSLSPVEGADAAPAGVAAAGAAAAVDSEESPGDPGSRADARSEADEADESALSAAALDAEATGAPGAAAALAAAAGAAWAAEPQEERDEHERHEEPFAESGVPAGTLEARDVSSEEPSAELGLSPVETDGPAETPEPAAAPSGEAQEDLGAIESPETASAPSWYAVAGTGVIDIVPAAGRPSEPEPADTEGDDEPAASPADDPWAPEDANPDVDALGEIDDELSEPEPEPEPEPEHADASADPWAPEDANPDVDALGEIDDELSEPEPADADDDRPWEHYVKTESDVEADAFFAAFDADGNPRVAPEPGAASEPQTDPGNDPEPESEPSPAPDPGNDPEPEPEPSPVPDAGPEPDTDPQPDAPRPDAAAEDAASVPSPEDDAARAAADESAADDRHEAVDQEGSDR